MSDLAFRVENISKLYHIGQVNNHSTLRDALANLVRYPFQRHRTADPARDGTFWALRNVSFELKRGEVLGIIGRNGAGKSTLFKILSRITEPTNGCVEGYGRVGSLLEVGTGFHPELTGRENIFLNGAILGMKKREIEVKFDEIVDFSEIGQFLDTPVKYYSSGMYMRLAFAVAAHLEPEILIVDEVLAVGDSAFQKKCLGKMSEVAQQHRTVLFVSHNMSAIQSLCTRAIWLDKGQIASEGACDVVISDYLQTTFSSQTNLIWENIETAPGNDAIRLQRATVRPLQGTPHDPITVRTPFAITVTYWNLVPGAFLNINFQVSNEKGVVIFEAGPIHEPIWRPLPVGLFHDLCEIPGNLLNDGMYQVSLQAVTDQGTLVFKKELNFLNFEVQDTNDLRDGWFGKWGGVIRPVLEWKRTQLETGGTESQLTEKNKVLAYAA